jgi:hypothetical protein
MAETRPIIDSLDSSDDEETTVTSSIKRKEPPIKQTEDESKKRKSQAAQPGVACMTCHSKAHSSKFCPKRIEALEQDRETLLRMQSHQVGGPQPTSYSSAPYPHAPAPSSTTPYSAYPSTTSDPYSLSSLSSSYASSSYGSSSYPSDPYAAYNSSTHGGYPSTYEGYSYDPRTGQYIPTATGLDNCLKCGRAGHNERDCHGPSVATPLSRCFNCNSKGHLAKDCKKGVLPTTCYNCGEPGHIGKLCPTAGTDLALFAKVLVM